MADGENSRWRCPAVDGEDGHPALAFAMAVARWRNAHFRPTLAAATVVLCALVGLIAFDMSLGLQC